MFINRDYNLTEVEDFKLNVVKHLGQFDVAVCIYHPTEEYVLGWKIQDVLA
jgi:hypothetical protein